MQEEYYRQPTRGGDPVELSAFRAIITCILMKQIFTLCFTAYTSVKDRALCIYGYSILLSLII